MFDPGGRILMFNPEEKRHLVVTVQKSAFFVNTTKPIETSKKLSGPCLSGPYFPGPFFACLGPPSEVNICQNVQPRSKKQGQDSQVLDVVF